MFDRSRRDPHTAASRPTLDPAVPGKHTLTSPPPGAVHPGAPGKHPLTSWAPGPAAATQPPGDVRGMDSAPAGRPIQRVALHELFGPSGAPAQRKPAGGGAGGEPDAAVRSLPSGGGQAMPEDVRGKMERAFQADFSAVRVHEGEHAAALGARAYTQGNDIHFAPGQYQPHSEAGQALLGHELAHVVQQSQGRVRATAQASGVALNDEGHLEREADELGARAARGEHAGTPQAGREDPAHGNAPAAVQRCSSSSVVQRYAVIEPGEMNYPTKWEYSSLWYHRDAKDDGDFFTSQKEQDGSFYSRNEDKKRRLEPKLVHKSTAKLMVSDNLDLAIEATKHEPKVFFATVERVKEANDALQGKVQLRMTNRYLHITGDRGAKSLYEVQPHVPETKQQGLEVRTPQRCNEMAEFVTGKLGVEFGATMQAYTILATILTELTHDDYTGQYAKAYDAYTKKGKRDPFVALIDAMSLRFRELQTTDKEALDVLLARYHLNEFMTPSIGDAITTFGVPTAEEEKDIDRDKVFLYHFGGVVAKSGTDYITMENYARRDDESKGTLSAGDPLFFFRMYGNHEEARNWHQAQLNTGSFAGTVLSFVVT
ncbi:MAG TPA: DUF4157 domain-containing protein [Kofleriaceae bacterium]|jgi:hypothetical protein|nr:DUF4157 domain-containing protein [Kofleriaceae bacterium]